MHNREINDLLNRKAVLLFYKEKETDKFFKYDRYLRKILRPLYQMTHNRQKKSGFAVSFDLMRRALIKSGYDVRINDYRTARDNPSYPVGIVGFPVILETWTLPNPAILGPSLYDHPMLAPNLMKDPRFRKYAVLGQWTFDMFRPIYGDACFSWFAGIDLDEWPDRAAEPKSFDFLIYDKRYDDEHEETLVRPILKLLDARGLTYRFVKYKMYDHPTYKKMLTDTHAMLFLCRHETQGLAYQEAMASGLPVLAWDQGFWSDPLWKKFSASPPKATSVPFFSAVCGEKFRDISEFESTLDRFIKKRSSYTPRDYVAQNLNMEKSAELYTEQYFSLLTNRHRP